MSIDDIKQEIQNQIESITHLQEHPEIAKHTIMHETDEYRRGALAMLNYLTAYIERK